MNEAMSKKPAEEWKQDFSISYEECCSSKQKKRSVHGKHGNTNTIMNAPHMGGEAHMSHVSFVRADVTLP